MITGIKGSCSPTKIKARASLVERQNFNMVKKRGNCVFWRCGNHSTYCWACMLSEGNMCQCYFNVGSCADAPQYR